jgi:hypothetical protein
MDMEVPINTIVEIKTVLRDKDGNIKDTEVGRYIDGKKIEEVK